MVQALRQRTVRHLDRPNRFDYNAESSDRTTNPDACKSWRTLGFRQKNSDFERFLVCSLDWKRKSDRCTGSTLNPSVKEPLVPHTRWLVHNLNTVRSHSVAGVQLVGSGRVADRRISRDIKSGR